MNDGRPAPEGEIGISPITGAENVRPAEKARFQFPRRRQAMRSAGNTEVVSYSSYPDPTLELLDRCARGNIFPQGIKRSISHTVKGGPKRFNTIYQELRPRLMAAIDHKRESVRSLEIPSDFSWENEWREAFPFVRDVLTRDDTFHIPDAILADAANFASENNAVFVPSQDRGRFFPDEYRRTLHINNPLDEKRLPEIPPPKTPEEQAKVILSVGRESIIRAALDFLNASANAGNALSSEQALRLAMVKAAANEFGHAIDYALAFSGVQTFARAEALLKNEIFTHSDILLPVVGVEIHRELFARGVDEIAVQGFLREKFGYSEEQLHTFFTEYRSHKSPPVQQVRRLLAEYPTDAERTMLVRTQNDMRSLIVAVDPQHVKETSPHFELALKYNAAPYSREAIAHIAANPR